MDGAYRLSARLGVLSAAGLVLLLCAATGSLPHDPGDPSPTPLTERAELRTPGGTPPADADSPSPLVLVFGAGSVPRGPHEPLLSASRAPAVARDVLERRAPDAPPPPPPRRGA